LSNRTGRALAETIVTSSVTAVQIWRLPIQVRKSTPVIDADRMNDRKQYAVVESKVYQVFPNDASRQSGDLGHCLKVKGNNCTNP